MACTCPKSLRESPLRAGDSALLVVDVQYYCCDPAGGMFAGLTASERDARFGLYFSRLQQTVLPNLQLALAACRGAGIEVLYTTIEALTSDGRDQSLDYKMGGILVPRGSRDACVLDAVAPQSDEIRLSKTASSVFNATNIDYVLRNLGILRLAIAGVLTDQCVETTVRDACDRSYLVTLVEDACATLTDERQAHALQAMRGCCRQVTTSKLVDELTSTRS